MKAKQRTIRVFEFFCDDQEAFELYLQKNSELLRGFLLLLSGPKAQEFAKLLEKLGLCYLFAKPCMDELIGAKKETIVQQTVEIAPQPIHQSVQKNLFDEVQPAKESQSSNVNLARMKLERPIRSGETIEWGGDLVIFGRINSGAKVKCMGCLELFDTVDGDVECAGEYMILKSIGKGSVVFRGVKIAPSDLSGRPTRLTYKNGVFAKEL